LRVGEDFAPGQSRHAQTARGVAYRLHFAVGGRIGRRDGSCDALLVLDDEDAAVEERHLELDERPLTDVTRRAFAGGY
jgi:hypothetical protein